MNPYELNKNTQPTREMPVFNNWGVVARAWYFALRSDELKKKSVKSVTLCSQRIALFRGDDGSVRAIDSFCPHMGVDLALGSVQGNELQCFFHHWRFSGEGKCTKIPASDKISPRANLHSWAVEEKYGLIWVFPDSRPDFPLPGVMALDGQEVRGIPGRAFNRLCHHHINMINGIDPQHLKTVHGMQTEMKLKTLDQGLDHQIEYILEGRQSLRHPLAKLVRFLTGGEFTYSMRFSGGSVGCISVNQNVRLRGLGWRLPALHMIFAYRPNLQKQVTEVQTIHIIPKHKGVLGGFLDGFLLKLTAFVFGILRDEDGMIYDNIRFRPNALLPIDAPISQYMAYVNRLRPSIWSSTWTSGAPQSQVHPLDDRSVQNI
jgi:phenylpropionate dioxygenase-like ring-hydroxylating dioxygenase large terminal subunit